MQDLTEQIYEAYDKNVSVPTENALRDLEASVDALSNSLRANEKSLKENEQSLRANLVN